jgi:hypothetical protein
MPFPLSITLHCHHEIVPLMEMIYIKACLPQPEYPAKEDRSIVSVRADIKISSIITACVPNDAVSPVVTAIGQK